MSLVPDIVLVFKVNGQRKELNYRKIPFSAWSELKAALGFTPYSIIDATGTMDLEAIGALIWLERKQQERALRWNEVRRDLEKNEYEFKVIGVITDGKIDFEDEDEAADAPEAEAPPTTASV